MIRLFLLALCLFAGTSNAILDIDAIARVFTVDKRITLLFITRGNLDFFYNWHNHAMIHNPQEQIVILTYDKYTYEVLSLKLGKGVYMADEAHLLGETQGSMNYGTKDFNLLSRTRQPYILQFLFYGFTVFLCDIDVVWLKDTSDICSDPECDVCFQTDASTYHGAITNPSSVLNAGVYLIRPTGRAIEFMIHWNNLCKQKKYMHVDDQRILQQIIDKVRKSGINMCMLPLSDAVPGSFYFTHTPRIDTKIVHNNYVIGHETKKLRFIQSGLWNITGYDT